MITALFVAVWSFYGGSALVIAWLLWPLARKMFRPILRFRGLR